MDNPANPTDAHYLLSEEAKVSEGRAGDDDHCQSILEGEGEGRLVESERGAADEEGMRVGLFARGVSSATEKEGKERRWSIPVYWSR